MVLMRGCRGDDKPELYKCPSLDSWQKRLLLAYKEVNSFLRLYEFTPFFEGQNILRHVLPPSGSMNAVSRLQIVSNRVD